MDILKNFIKDGGLASRKMWITVLSLVLLSSFVVVAAKYSAIVSLYSVFSNSILGILGLYLTGNVSSRWIASKQLGSTSNNQESSKTETNSKENI